MSGSSLLQELERTEEVLEVLLDRISSIIEVLEPIERTMRVTDFSSSGVYVQGTSNGIVCALTALIRGDPMEQVLRDKKGIGIPALIKAGDRSESPSTVDNIVKMVLAESEKKSLDFIVNLRWAVFPKSLENGRTLVFGSRYVSGHPRLVKKLQEKLEAIGVIVIEDDGEFGGGPLVFEFIKSFRNKNDSLVIEITLSESLSKNVGLVTGILNVLADF
jgi:hypothetical protein